MYLKLDCFNRSYDWIKNGTIGFQNSIHYPLILYCGKVLRRSQEVEDLKFAVGNSIIFNQFLSTTLNREIASIFADSSSTDSSHGEGERVLMTIIIDSLSLNGGPTVFANISSFSHFSEE